MDLQPSRQRPHHWRKGAAPRPDCLCKLHKTKSIVVGRLQEAEGILRAARVDPQLGGCAPQPVEHRVAVDAEAAGGGRRPGRWRGPRPGACRATRHRSRAEASACAGRPPARTGGGAGAPEASSPTRPAPPRRHERTAGRRRARRWRRRLIGRSRIQRPSRVRRATSVDAARSPRRRAWVAAKRVASAWPAGRGVRDDERAIHADRDAAPEPRRRRRPRAPAAAGRRGRPRPRGA